MIVPFSILGELISTCCISSKLSLSKLSGVNLFSKLETQETQETQAKQILHRRYNNYIRKCYRILVFCARFQDYRVVLC